jgi:hypothetical protein
VKKMAALEELREFYEKQLDGKYTSQRQLTEIQIMLAGIDAAIQLRDRQKLKLEGAEIKALQRDLAEQNKLLLQATGESLAQTLQRFEAGEIMRRQARRIAKKTQRSQPKRAPGPPRRPR